jgi:hypothetical protein
MIALITSNVFINYDLVHANVAKIDGHNDWLFVILYIPVWKLIRRSPQ